MSKTSEQYLCICVWALSSVPLVYMSVLYQLPVGLYYVFMSGSRNAPVFSSFSSHLAILVPLSFNINFRILLPILIGVVLNLWINGAGEVKWHSHFGKQSGWSSE